MPGHKAFDPTEFPSFADTVLSSESGELELPYDNGSWTSAMRLHYRWFPEDSRLENRSLLVIGVGEESVMAFHSWLVVGVVVLIAVTFLINMTFVLLLCYLGRYRDKFKRSV